MCEKSKMCLVNPLSEAISHMGVILAEPYLYNHRRIFIKISESQ
jgi:hypothetical protein